uniref:Putative pbp/gobp family n=1 Tax=Corethrella appendiculata TaxID=1370023 RepID=U5ESI5_9DIPT
MKFLILLICVSLISGELTREDFRQYITECKESLGLDDKATEAYKKSLPAEEPYPCFAHCIGEKSHVFDDTTGPNLEPFSKKYSTTVMENIKKCFNEIAERDDKCKWAYAVTKCVRSHHNDQPSNNNQ